MSDTPLGRYRYFLYLAYDGSAYHGWQRQPNGLSVQQCLEEALSLLLRRETAVTGAGRTDTGVHARLMVAHFDTSVPLTNLEAWRHHLNCILPPDIAISCIRPVTSEAHSRFDALSRTYRYYISYAKNPFAGRYRWYLSGQRLDVAAMNEAAALLRRHDDFTSFSKTHTDVKNFRCRITCARWEERGDELVFTITADRFLRNMVRAIVGTLVDIGRGKLPVTDFLPILEARDRRCAGVSAPACALFLTDITYPETLFLP
ncbi:MAG: tRNA pseudouridine(38-40) synthase TruA [Porphyromonadaceae bacterium]|nr:tRNA pseudouridine(38-40) synthase TruA [Porphyromonadaceae bacterium]